MAFYAKLLDGDKLKLSEKETEEWRRDLPRAVEAQHFLIDKQIYDCKFLLAFFKCLNLNRLSE